MKDRLCGFCMTGHHENCKPKVSWYDKEWLCYCTICQSSVVLEQQQTEQEQETKNE